MCALTIINGVSFIRDQMQVFFRERKREHEGKEIESDVAWM